MTPTMAGITNILEAQLRPGLSEFIDKEYRTRAGHFPLPGRTTELLDACMNRMRLKLEECYDHQMNAGEVKSHCMLAIRLALAEELDKEFPKPIVTLES